MDFAWWDTTKKTVLGSIIDRAFSIMNFDLLSRTTGVNISGQQLTMEATSSIWTDSKQHRYDRSLIRCRVDF